MQKPCPEDTVLTSPGQITKIKDVGVLLLAGGKSTRFGGENKLDLTLNGRDLVQIALDKYTGKFEHVVVSIYSLCDRSPFIMKGVEVIPAAESKGLSILTALEYFESIDIKSIILAEAARPFTVKEHVELLVEMLGTGSNAIISGFPSWESIYCADGKKNTVLPREQMYIGQTPEGWDVRVLRNAIQIALFQDTDISYSFAAALQASKLTVDFCEGSRENIKVTYEIDALIAEAIAKEFPDLLTWRE